MSKHGLALHVAICDVKGPSGPRHRSSQIASVDVVSAVSGLKYNGVAAQAEAMTDGSTAQQLLDTYQLAGGKVTLRLPKPPASLLPCGWAVRTERSVTHKTPQQLLYLLEEFLKNKLKGRQARKDVKQLAEELLPLGPPLSDSQITTHFSLLQRKWNASKEKLTLEVEELKLKVLSVAAAASREGHARDTELAHAAQAGKELSEEELDDAAGQDPMNV